MLNTQRGWNSQIQNVERSAGQMTQFLLQQGKGILKRAGVINEKTLMRH